VTALGPELLQGLVERAGRSDLPAFEAQLRGSGNCARPIRLRGTVTVCDGHGHRRVWTTDTEPDGVLRKACGNRREAVCAPCAERYRQDAYHLIAAGLRGGKGVPDTISGHPAVFLTLTAPSFGVVHTRPLGPDGQPRRCRPRRDDPVCPHGVRLSCGVIHGEGDPCLGEPLCPRCFDYAGAVTWNNTLGALWRYTTIYVPRCMAERAGITQSALREQVRVAYAKVAEYQRRGLVHLHVLARLDRAMPDYRADELHAPEGRFDVELLERSIRDAIETVSAPVGRGLGQARVRWGDQVDMRRLQTGEQRAEIAGYLAKYATKSTEQAGGLLHRIAPDEVETAPVREHVRTFMRTAFELDTTAKQHAPRPAHVKRPTVNVESDWHPAALAIRLQDAMSTREPVRVREHDNTVHTGRVVRLLAAAERRDTTLVVELDSGARVHLADVASVGPAERPAPRLQRDRRDPRLARCAHAFGYRGHCLTKSRRYSTTFKALREAREAYVHEQLLARSTDATQRAIATAETRTAAFEFAGVGHVTAADAFLAASAAARAREQRRLAREAARDGLMAGLADEIAGRCGDARGGADRGR